MKRMTSIVATLSALAVAGCGGGANNILSGGPSGSFTTTSANMFKGELGNNIPGFPSGTNGGTMSLSFQGMPSGGISTQSVNQRAALNCETVVSDNTDADNDDIIVSKKSTYDCSDFAQSGDTWQIQGTVESSDKDDSVMGLAGGYRINIDLKTNRTDADGTNLTYTTEGLFDAEASGNTSTFTSKFNQEFSGTQYAYSKLFTISYIYQTDFKVVYTRSTGTTGTVEMDGLIGIDGSFPEGGKLETAKFTMKISAENLTYDTTCPLLYDSGTVKYVDGKGNILAATYACNTTSYTLNGTAL